MQTLGLGEGRREGTFRILATAPTVTVAWATALSRRVGEKQGSPGHIQNVDVTVLVDCGRRM